MGVMAMLWIRSGNGDRHVDCKAAERIRRQKTLIRKIVGPMDVFYGKSAPGAGTEVTQVTPIRKFDRSLRTLIGLYSLNTSIAFQVRSVYRIRY